MSPRTQDAYVSAVYGLAKHYHQSPDGLNDGQIKDYLAYLKVERELAPSSIKQVVSGLRCFYQLVLERDVQELRRHECGAPCLRHVLDGAAVKSKGDRKTKMGSLLPKGGLSGMPGGWSKPGLCSSPRP